MNDKQNVLGAAPRLPQLTACVHPEVLPRLVLWKGDLCIMLGVKLRTLERMISAGEIPAPDRRLRGRPAWLARTIQEWATAGCQANSDASRRIPS